MREEQEFVARTFPHSGSLTDAERRLVSAYLEYWSTKDQSLFSAYEQVDDIVQEESERGWDIMLALVEAAPSDEALAYVAAGPVEDWVRCHGHGRAEQVLLAGRRIPKFRRALSGVWVRSGMSPDVTAVIQKLLGSPEPE